MLLLEWQQTVHSVDVSWFTNLSYFRRLLTLQVVPLTTDLLYSKVRAAE